MNIPKTLKIGGHLYTVIEKETEDCGLCNRDKNEIVISKSLAQSQKEATLIHEILHALNWEFEETEIEAMAQGIYQVFKDNLMFK